MYARYAAASLHHITTSFSFQFTPYSRCHSSYRFVTSSQSESGHNICEALFCVGREFEIRPFKRSETI